MSDVMPERIDLATTSISDEKLAHLLQLFPEAFTEGKIDFDALRRSLGETVDTDPANERFGLRWPGKSKLQEVINGPSVGTLVPQPDESVDWDTTQNVIIEGDNLEVLKLLQKSYAGKVKMIYIDPPYNTGTDFVYPDNFTEGLQTYLEFTGQVDGNGRKTQSNTETTGRYHANWLNMMYPRLYLARNLLRDDGVIFVSIDDHEVHNLRALMNEVYGEENFVASVIWKKMDSPSRNEELRAISNYHDYIVIYCRNREASRLRQRSKDSILDAYNVTLDDGRLARYRQLRKNGKSARRSDRPTLWFPLTAPDGSTVYPIAPEGWEGRWVLSAETWEVREREGLTQWVKRDYGWVPYYIELAPDDPSVPWPTIWDGVGQNRQATAALTNLMGPVEFDNPKPVDLVRDMLLLATPPSNEIVLDFFAGSGTTAHAVKQQNAEDGGNRRYILVQLPEPLDELKTLDDRTVLNDIADICRERVRRAGRKVREDHAEALAEREKPLDTGFRAYRLAHSNFRPWDGRLAGGVRDTAKQLAMIPSSVADQLRFAADHLRPDATDAAILAELLLKIGIDLTAPVTIEQLADKRVYNVEDGTVLICLDRHITLDVIEQMAANLPSEIICLDSGFPDDQTKVNAGQIIAGYARDEEASIQFKVV
jgi:adenine-specific DNA-methyltransferase